MEKHRYTKSLSNLSIITVIFLLIIIIGSLSTSNTGFEYKLSPKETVELALSTKDELTPVELNNIVTDGKPGYQIIDLRNPHEFIKGHIEGAINIPYAGLLEEENLEIFGNGSVVTILYGMDQQQATGPYMILKQLGYDKIKLLLGGYDFYSTLDLNLDSLYESSEYLVEEPRYDYAEIIGTSKGNNISVQKTEPPEPIIPSRKKKKTAIEGGC